MRASTVVFAMLGVLGLAIVALRAQSQHAPAEHMPPVRLLRPRSSSTARGGDPSEAWKQQPTPQTGGEISDSLLQAESDDKTAVVDTDADDDDGGDDEAEDPPSEEADLAPRANPFEEVNVKSICDLPEFAAGSPQLNLTVMVFAWRRLSSLRRLIKSLQNAEYCNRTVPIKLFLDVGAHEQVRQFVEGVQWSHGPRLVRAYADERPLGIRGMWINAAPPEIGDDEHILPLEDDLEVSPYYYWWLLRAARKYGPFSDAAHVRTEGIVGVSLYTPRLNEIVYPQKKWVPDRATASPAFVLQVPCSWGALFIGSVWREFLSFYRERIEPPFFDFGQEARQKGAGRDREKLGDPSLFLPGSRSNVWPRSWKRFLVDFMYGRGYVMIYPNLREQLGFSTTYMERGAHTAKDGLQEAIKMHELRNDVDPLKTTPLVTSEVLNEAVIALGGLDGSFLPASVNLPTFDIHHRRRSRPALRHQGLAFTENVRWWGRRAAESQPKLAMRYTKLAELWAGVLAAAQSTAGCALTPPPLGVADPREVEAAIQEFAQGEGAAAANATNPPSPEQMQQWASLFEREQQQRSRGATYLTYQPMSGVGEYVVALKNAAGLARALNRTLVIPHMLWEGKLKAAVPFSSVFELAPLRKVLQAAGINAIEADEFMRLKLAPTAIAMLHVKDPRLQPARTYFDDVFGWRKASAVHLPAQMASAADFNRLYGGCLEPVLALSHTYAAFEGWPEDSEEQEWFESITAAMLSSGGATITRKAQGMIQRLRRKTGQFTCLHLTDLDNAWLTPRGSDLRELGTTGADDGEGGGDVNEPAARAVPFFGGDDGSFSRKASAVCDAYDAEANSPLGRSWVRDTYQSGYACAVDDEIIVANLPRLPKKDPVFIFVDGRATMPQAIVDGAAAALSTDFLRMADVIAQGGVQVVSSKEWMALEAEICTNADAMMLNQYSPLSSMLLKRSQRVRESRVMKWVRVDSDECIPLFTRTARFDIQPNRFGILGQFGPERKLQLSSTNLTSLIGWDGRIIPNASIEFDIYVSNASHSLATFEYTKYNNQYGINIGVTPPIGGWRSHTWHSMTMQIHNRDYSYPAKTPWGAMDRLELYYTNPHYTQPHGDYIRIRNVYVRSTRSFQRITTKNGEKSVASSRCRDLDLYQRLRQLKTLHAGGAQEQENSLDAPVLGGEKVAIPKTSEESVGAYTNVQSLEQELSGGGFRTPRPGQPGGRALASTASAGTPISGDAVYKMVGLIATVALLVSVASFSQKLKKRMKEPPPTEVTWRRPSSEQPGTSRAEALRHRG